MATYEEAYGRRSRRTNGQNVYFDEDTGEMIVPTQFEERKIIISEEIVEYHTVPAERRLVEKTKIVPISECPKRSS